MEQLIKKESQKLIDEQIRQARIQRQKQVRQQAMAWTDATRKKFEDARERGIKTLALAVTDQVQSAAIENIKLLTKQNDLVLAEIGMAHRAAAGMQQVEKMKSLKRLRNQELAKNRGTEAMAKLIKGKEAQSEKNLAILKRKEEVRRVEDTKSKELISRRPLMVQNADKGPQETNKLHPPKYHQSLAKTLRVAVPDAKGKKAAPGLAQSPSKAKAKPPHHQSIDVHVPKRPPRREKNYVVKKTSSLEVHDKRRTENEIKERKSQGEGLLPQMVQIHIRGGSEEKLDPNIHPERLISGLALRSKYMSSINPPSALGPPSTVRYFDAALPKGEVKYVAPAGLAVKEVRNSPDAWTKGKISSNVEMEERNMKLQNDEEMKRRADERAKKALKLAQLEKQRTAVKNELMREIDPDNFIGGSQKAFLGLDDSQTADAHSPGKSQQGRAISSDEFSVVGSDDEDFFPKSSSKTMKQYKVTEDERDSHPVLIPEVESNGDGDSGTVEKPGTELSRPFTPDSYSSYSSPSSARSIDGNPPPPIAHSGRPKPSPQDSAKVSDKDRKRASDVPATTPPKIRKKPKDKPNLDEYDSVSLSDDGSVGGGRRSEEKGKSNLSIRSTSSSTKNRSTPDRSHGQTSSSSRSTLAEVNVLIPEDRENLIHIKSPAASAKGKPKTGRKGSRSSLSHTNNESTGSRAQDKPQPTRKEIRKPKTEEKRHSSTDSVGSLNSPRGPSSSENKRHSSTSSKSNPNRSSSSRGKHQSSSDKSGSTIAEVNVLTESMESKASSLNHLQARAEEQERILRGDAPRTRTELPVEVTLKVRKSKDRATTSNTPSPATPTSGSENTSASSTDYYHLPEGPYTSTPDGKLQQKRLPKKDKKEKEDMGKRALGKYLDKFLKRRPESIEKLPVSSSHSSSSVIRLDQDLVEASENQGNSSMESENRSSNSSGYSNKSNSPASSTPPGGNRNPNWKNKTGPLSTLSEETGEAESRSTVAEAKKIILNISHSSKDSDQDLVSYNSGSLPGMLYALASHQGLDRMREESSVASPSEPSSGRSQNQSSSNSGPSHNSTLLTSGDDVHGSTAYLSRILQRQSRRASREASKTASGEDSSSKSGPDVEAKRLVEELLEDITPVKLMDTPEVKRTSNGMETEELSAVFENLIKKWSEIKIDPPPLWDAVSK